MLNKNYVVMTAEGTKHNVLAYNARLALIKHCLRQLGFKPINEDMFKRELELKASVENKIYTYNGYLKVYNFSVKV